MEVRVAARRRPPPLPWPAGRRPPLATRYILRSRNGPGRVTWPRIARVYTYVASARGGLPRPRSSPPFAVKTSANAGRDYGSTAKSVFILGDQSSTPPRITPPTHRSLRTPPNQELKHHDNSIAIISKQIQNPRTSRWEPRRRRLESSRLRTHLLRRPDLRTLTTLDVMASK